jgi:hypothetical protein
MTWQHRDTPGEPPLGAGGGGEGLMGHPGQVPDRGVVLHLCVLQHHHGPRQ